MAKLFVSYSRRDSVAARRLIEAFRSIEQDVWVDWESIPPAVDWLEQIFRGIEESDAFIFLISPDSIASEVCKVELNHAAQNNKRIIPIVLRDVPAKETPDSIRKLNWTYIRETDNFEEGLAKVKTAIELDLDWLEEHRRLQVRSLEWHRRNDPSLLLRGRDLRNARHMLATATSKDPRATDLQRTYINRSIQSERNRTIAWISGIVALIIMAVLSVIAVNRSVEALRQQGLAEANAEEANIQAVYARLNQRKAESNERLALENEKEAEQARDAAREAEIQAEAQRSAARAQIYLARPGELFTSTLLAIDSMRRDPSSAEAEEILRRNLSLLPLPVRQFAQAEKINDLVFNPAGDTFVTASADGTACVWRVEEDELTNLFCTEPQGAATNAVAFSPDGSFLVTGDQVGLVQVLDSETGDILHAFRRVDLPGSRIQLVDLQNQDLPEGSTPQEIPVRSISVRPTRIPQLAVAYDDGEIPIFDPNSTKISSPISAINRPNVSGVSPNGGWLVIGSESGRVSIWDLANDNRFSPSTHRGGVLAMAFHPTANKVATAGGDTIAMINPTIQKELYRIPIQSPIRDIAFSSDGAWFVTGSDDHRVRVWDTLSGNELLSMVQDGVVTDVAVSSNGEWIASTGDDRTVRLWDAETGAELFQVPLKAAGSRVGFLNEDKWLVTTDQSGAIGIWDISGMTLPALSLPFEGIAEHVAYSPDGEKLAVSSGDKIWLLTPDPEAIVKEAGLGQPVQDFNSNVSKLVFTPDSTQLGILTEENEVALYNVESRKSLSIPVTERILSIAFTPDSQQLIASDMNGNLQAWDVADAEAITDSDGFPQGTLLAGAGDLLVVGSPDSLVVLDEDPNGSLTEAELSGEKALLAVSPDGSRIASSSPDGKVTLFQYEGGQLTELTSFVKDQASSLAFSPNGTLLALGTAKNVYLMDPATGKEVGRIPYLSAVNGVAFSPDGAYLAVTSSRSLNFWALAEIQQIRSEDLIAGACLHLYENLSTTQWEQFFGREEYEPLCKALPTP